jgi:hypothetical protein
LLSIYPILPTKRQTQKKEPFYPSNQTQEQSHFISTTMDGTIPFSHALQPNAP